MRPRPLLVLCILAAALSGASAGQTPSLQAMIDATAPGGVLRPEPGAYAGPVTIAKPMTLDGRGAVVVKGDGAGTVIAIEGSGVTVQGLTIRDSGVRHDKVDAAITASGRYHVIKDNRIENCLFGINLHQAHNSIVRRNVISSRPELELPQKGDAIRLWYSNDNLVEGNLVSGARDSVVWYSRRNKVIGNKVEGGQYGIHFMYAHENVAERNVLRGGVVGIFVMFGEKNRLAHNRIEYAQGPSGMGIGFKEGSGSRVEDNDILGNAVGIYLDASPYEPDLNNEFVENRIAFNGIAVQLHSDLPGNTFARNDFVSNHTMVTVNGGGGATNSRWEGNHYDFYEGFDRNRDGVGDTPLQVFSWADRLWMDIKEARFFRASAALELIDFIERLMPLSEPRLMMRDESPQMRRIARAPKE